MCEREGEINKEVLHAYLHWSRHAEMDGGASESHSIAHGGICRMQGQEGKMQKLFLPAVRQLCAM